MLKTKAIRIWIALLVAYATGATAIAAARGDVEEIVAFAAIVPFVFASVLQHFSIPGMLEHGGYCGWGMCNPTTAGWLVGSGVTAGLLWLVALALAGRGAGSGPADVSGPRQGRRQRRSGTRPDPRPIRPVVDGLQPALEHRGSIDSVAQIPG